MGILKKMPAEKKAKGKTAKKANGKARALALKKSGKGIFAVKTLSSELAAICGGESMRTEVTKKLWKYIKAKSLSAGRTITPDAALAKVFPKKSFSMFEMAKMVSSHLK